MPRALPLSSEARKIYISYVNEVEEKLKSDGAFSSIRGLANKLPEHAVRLGAVLNFFENPSIGEVDSYSMEAGIALANHYAAEALRLFSASKGSEKIQQARRLLHWLHTEWPEQNISLIEIYQLGPNSIRDKETAQKAVDILEEHGWMVLLPDGNHIVAGVRRRRVWRIHR